MPNQSFKFGNTMIGVGSPCFIIAEIGINHEGDVEVCKQMIKSCADAGADAVKLQTSDPDENYHPDSVSYEVYKKSYLNEEQTAEVFNYARSLGLEVFTTSGLRTLEWVEKLAPSGYKISSGLLTHFHLVEQTVKKGRPVILSTGLSTYDDIDKMVQVFQKHDLADYAILQCTSLYPCPEEQIHLSAIRAIESRYGVVSGLSDHSISDDVPALAVAAGAKIIEKHFSLDPSREGFDHFISLDFEGFSRMVKAIRRAETLLGSPDKVLIDAIKEKRKNMERFVFSARKLTKGKAISMNDLLFLRAQNDKAALLSAAECETLFGKILLRDIDPIEPVLKQDVQG